MYYEISFPHLGLSFDPSRVAFSLFGKPVYWYGVIIALGFVLAVLYCCRRAPDFGITTDQVIDMLIAAVPTAIICARAYYCIFNWEAYRDNPVSCLYIWNGGLAIYGGVIGGFAAAAVFCRVKKLSPAAMLDLGGFGFPIGQAIGRWGNFFNREAFGVIRAGSDPFFKMGLADASGAVTYVHPTFLYESVWNAAGFLILHFVSRRRKFDGQILLLYLAWYGLGRGMIEGLRADSLYLGNLRVSQLLAFASCLVAAALLFYHLVLRDHEPEELFVNRVRQAGAVTAKDDEASAEDETPAASDADELEAEEPPAKKPSTEPSAKESDREGEA